jgi:hypothetical protein
MSWLRQISPRRSRGLLWIAALVGVMSVSLAPASGGALAAPAAAAAPPITAAGPVTQNPRGKFLGAVPSGHPNTAQITVVTDPLA